MGLNQALLSELLDYDPSTGKLFWKERDEKYFSSLRACRSWNGKYANKEAMTANHSTGYLSGTIFGTSYLAHRVIWILCYGYEPQIIDHNDGDKKNNRIANLQDVSCEESMKNLPRAKNNKSSVTGVHWNKATSKWAVQIKVNKRSIHLGYFNTLEEATKVRKSAEQQHSFNLNHGRN